MTAGAADHRSRIVIAPDSFKGSITAADAADAIAAGWHDARPDDDLRCLSQADGGEGTLDAIARAVPGAEFVDAGPVHGPDGGLVPGAWLRLPDGTSVVELARSSGLPLLAAPAPLTATTRGLGETIAHALDAGAPALVVGLGGSASTDGGAGLLAALGLRLSDAAGAALPDGGGALAGVTSVDRGALRPLPPGGVRVLSDVDAPLVGPRGAAAVFGPQKGAGPDDVRRLDAALARFAALLGGDATIPGAGAAGGTGFGLAAWGARIEPGAAAIAGITGLAEAVRGADLLITGEGRFDATSLTGKATGHALGLAEAAGVPAAVVAGRVAVDPPRPGGRAVAAVALDRLAGGAEAAMADPARWLRAAGAMLARG